MSPFLSLFNVTPALTTIRKIPQPPSTYTTPSQHVSLTVNNHDTVPQLRRRGRPPSQENVPQIWVACLPPQNDRMSSLTNPTPPVMLSPVTIVDNQGNSRHLPQSARVTNPANSTRHVIGLNNSTPRHIYESANTGQNGTNVSTSVYQTQCQQRRMTEYADSGHVTYTCVYCQAKYWYGERTVRRLSTSNPRFSTCCIEGKVVLPLLCLPPPLLIEVMDYNGGERSKLFGKKLKLLNSMMAKDRFVQSSIQPVTLRLISTRQHTGRQYNLPTASEVPALIPSDGNPTDSCDVIVEEHGTLLKYPFSYLNKGPDRATIVIKGQRNEARNNNTTTTANINNTTFASRVSTTNNTTPTTTANNNNSRTPYQAILQHENEIEQYLSCCYIFASESCWHLLGYKMHYRSIVVERLPFHEEGCNRVYFTGDDQLDNVIDRETSSMSKFTEWMKANEMYPELGSTLMYGELPTKFTWQDKEKDWRPRKNGMNLGRISYVSPLMGEKFYLRMLLNVIVVPQEILNGNNKSLLDFSELPQIDYTLMNIGGNRLIVAERMYSANEEWSRFTSLYGGLNPQQRDVYDNIMLDNPNADNQVFSGKVVVLVNVTNVDEMMQFHNWLIAMGDGRLPSIALDG
ncbi:hypothetical protein Tco_0620456 [Tanacetum coccineum]